MGEVQTALLDPMAGHFNAGSMGIYSLDNNFSFAYSGTDWLKGWWNSDLYIDHAQLFTGWKLAEKTEDNSTEISCGIDFGRRLFDLGETERRGENNEYLGMFEAWERNYSAGASIGLRNIIEIGVGIKFNYLSSNLLSYENNPPIVDEESIQTYDWGVMIRLPLSNALSELYSIDPNILVSPFKIDVIPSFGYSRSNQGGNIRDPLLKINREGYALETRFDLPDISLLAFIYAQDFKMERYFPAQMGWNEISGIGREIVFFDSFIYRWGEYYDEKHLDSRVTTGFTMQTRGILKIIYIVSQNQEWARGNRYEFVMNRVNIRYSRSSWEGTYNNILDTTEWVEFGISF
ncbi:MAG: hypothetical protein P9L92_20650 [Candidatus Electryonea clarkiae]|nr:hypothetical protein [Candidatus Electryonea clarkiae]MDP8288879.1 hypothetical protein [Candidatus Electryonea clarkiae]